MKWSMYLRLASVALLFVRTGTVIVAQCCVHSLRTIPELQIIAPQVIQAVNPVLAGLCVAMVIVVVVDVVDAWYRIRKLVRWACRARRVRRQHQDDRETS